LSFTSNGSTSITSVWGNAGVATLRQLLADREAAAKGQLPASNGHCTVLSAGGGD
jgi:hypothetical protein